jgi:hypothetical protein
MKETPEYKAFEQALGKVLQVTHTEMQERLEAEKEQKEKKRKSKKTSVSSRASGGKD